MGQTLCKVEVCRYGNSWTLVVRGIGRTASNIMKSAVLEMLVRLQVARNSPPRSLKVCPTLGILPASLTTFW